MDFIAQKLTTLTYSLSCVPVLQFISFVAISFGPSSGLASDATALSSSGELSCPRIIEIPVYPRSTAGKFTNFVANTGRRSIGAYYIGAAHAIDTFFSGEVIDQNTNDSYLKGELRGTQFEQGKSDTDLRIKAKIKLPNTKKRARIFFDSDLREENSVDQRVRSVSRGEQLQTSSSTAGIEFIKQKKNPRRWRQSIKGGVKLNNSFDPFIRYRVQNKWQLADHLYSYFSQDFYYLDGVGWGETTRHQFLVNVNSVLDLDIISELDYRDEPQPIFFYHQWRLTQKVSDRTYLSYNAAILSEDSKQKYINKRVLSMDIRYRLPGDWFYLTLSPELLQQAESLWDNEWSLTLKLEFFFTEEQDSAFYRKRF